MSQPLQVGARVRIAPRAGHVVQVRPVTLKRRQKANGRYEPTWVAHRYLVKLDDGTTADLSPHELEADDDD